MPVTITPGRYKLLALLSIHSNLIKGDQRIWSPFIS